MNSIAVTSVLALIALVVVAGAFGWLVAGQALQPLRQITATARAIADRNLHQRVGMQGPQDEIKDLADTVDAMLERLDRAFDSQQRFIANASHELRTPLAINRTLIEVALLKEPKADTALAHLGANLLAINQRHERLIDGLLMLASSEQEIADRTPSNWRTSSGACWRNLRQWRRLRPSMCVRNSNPRRARAMRFCSSAWFRTSWTMAFVTTCPPVAGSASPPAPMRTVGANLVVENSGAMIPSYEVPRLFEPFRRLASTERQADVAGSLGRRGAGLGLSIVRSIVTSHGGDVQAVARADGGLLITVVLPQG